MFTFFFFVPTCNEIYVELVFLVFLWDQGQTLFCLINILDCSLRPILWIVNVGLFVAMPLAVALSGAGSSSAQLH